jgi:restriction system protein
VALWVVRAGRRGQHLTKFRDDNRVYLTWSGFNVDLAPLESRTDVSRALEQAYPDLRGMRLANNTGQIWRFAKEIAVGDWVIVPDRSTGSINVGEVTGPYVHVPDGPDPYFHYHDLGWIGTDVPRTNFAQDLLYSFGGLMTIYQVTRHEAEGRVRAMADRGWVPEIVPDGGGGAADGDESEAPDLEQLASDQVASLIRARFKGHGLARVVESVLQAQGYTTFRSPPGPDQGVDILAGSGALGFDEPLLCVQVKSGDSPVDAATLNQLIGAMQNVRARQGLLVSWGGFTRAVRQQEPSQFFRVRLWNQQTLLDAITQNYERLDESLRAELPLKRTWIVASDAAEEATNVAEPDA